VSLAAGEMTEDSKKKRSFNVCNLSLDKCDPATPPDGTLRAPRPKRTLNGGIEMMRRQFRNEEYFVIKILREATFLPPDLFEEEIERFLGPRAPRPQQKPAAAGTPSTKK
jgi:hypothetical protein